MKKCIFALILVALMVVATACSSNFQASSVMSSSIPTPSSASQAIDPAPTHSGETPPSPGNSDEEIGISVLEKQAEILTEHMVTIVMSTDSLSDVSSMADIDICIFILSLSSYMDNAAHPYRSYISKTPESIYIFPVANVQEIAYQLFGRKYLDLGDTIKGVDVKYNSEKQQYESGLEFGIGVRCFDCQNTSAQYLPENNTIEVTFTHLSYVEGAADPTWGNETEYKALYSIESDAGSSFLRLKSIMPAS